jgi:hypothetical protein
VFVVLVQATGENSPISDLRPEVFLLAVLVQAIEEKNTISVLIPGTIGRLGLV